MARLPNQYLFVKTLVDVERLFGDTKSYVVVGLRDAYEWKDGNRTDKIVAKTATLMCTRDEESYGVTKKGDKISNLKFEQFDIKVENLEFDVPKGTKVKIDLSKLVKAVGYSNSYGEQVSIVFSDLDVIK